MKAVSLGYRSTFFVIVSLVLLVGSGSFVWVAPPASGVASARPASGASPIGAGETPGLARAVPAVPVLPAGQIGGWDGASYNTSQCKCAPPEGNVASGAGFVVQVVQGEILVYNEANHALLRNASLGQFFHAPAGTSVQSPRVLFDASRARWFLTSVIANATGTGYILLNVSRFANPDLAWYQYRIDLGATALPQGLALALSMDQVVITDDQFSAGAFHAADAWILNKSATLDGTYKLADLHHYNSTVAMAFAPAVEIGSNNTAYLVSDCAAAASGICPGGTSLHYFSVTGVPPATVTVHAFTLTIPATSCLPYGKNCTVAGGVPQPGGTGIQLSSGDLRLRSAVWENGALWAAGNEGCKVGTAEVSCLHLVEVVTGTNKLGRDLAYAPGNSTLFYFDPAVTMDTASDLVFSFTRSGNTTLPTMELAALPPGGKVLAPTVAAASKVPYDPTGLITAGVCSATVPCPWSTSSGAATEPSNGSLLWFDGTYCPANCTTNYWSTWISRAVPSVPYTYLVTFAEKGLPRGTVWSTSYHGTQLFSTGSTIAYLERNGTVNFTVPAIAAGLGIRYLATPATGPVNVSGKSVTVNVTFTEQYLLTTRAVPAGVGTVSPATAWFDANATVNISATGSSGEVFYNWVGTGKGSYNGSSNPAAVHLGSPVTETADFEPGFAITFSETGLPEPGNFWTITLNGKAVRTNLTSIGFTVANGSYTYSISPQISLGYGDRAIAANDTGTVTVSGKAVGVGVTFLEQYLLSMTTTPNGSGVLLPGTGWYSAHAVINLSAGAGPGYRFIHWNGTGYGNYAGPDARVSLTLNGPINETAIFTDLGYIEGSVLPSSAQLSIDSTLVQVTTQGTFNDSVTGGNHFVVVSAPGYQTLYLNVSVLAASGVSLTLDLKATPAPSSAGGGTLLGMDPMLLLIIVIAVLAVLAVVAFLLGRKMGGKPRPKDGPEEAEPANASSSGPPGPGFPGGPPGYPPQGPAPNLPPWGPQ